MTVVLDASALIALIREEPGADRVAAIFGEAVMGAVNLAEVAGVFARDGTSRQQVNHLLGAFPLPIQVQGTDDALEVGLLRPTTDRAGLSLGDRYCLTLGRRLGARVLTADRGWAKVAEVVGVDVEVIR